MEPDTVWAIFCWIQPTGCHSEPLYQMFRGKLEKKANIQGKFKARGVSATSSLLYLFLILSSLARVLSPVFTHTFNSEGFVHG